MGILSWLFGTRKKQAVKTLVSSAWDRSNNYRSAPRPTRSKDNRQASRTSTAPDRYDSSSDTQRATNDTWFPDKNNDAQPVDDTPFTGGGGLFGGGGATGSWSDSGGDSRSVSINSNSEPSSSSDSGISSSDITIAGVMSPTRQSVSVV